MEVEKKYCFSCQHKREIEHFEEGSKSYNVCMAKSKRQYHNRKEYFYEYKKERTKTTQRKPRNREKNARKNIKKKPSTGNYAMLK